VYSIAEAAIVPESKAIATRVEARIAQSSQFRGEPLDVRHSPTSDAGFVEAKFASSDGCRQCHNLGTEVFVLPKPVTPAQGAPEMPIQAASRLVPWF
jgi:hypothetical protein